MKATNKAKILLGILIFLCAGLNTTSTEGESEDSLQLLVVGLKDNEAVLSGIGIGGDATGEVSIELKDESGNIITTEPLGVASNLSNNIWVSFADKKIRMYNTCGELQKIDGVNWYWQTSAIPDGLDYDGTNLQYCSSNNNKLYRINLANGQETEIGVAKRRISLDGVATDNTSVQYTTQEYEGYNPNSLSGNYLVSGGLGKISKRDLSIGTNFIQTIPSGTPIWTNEQDTPGSCLGVTQTPDDTVPEGHVVYLSCTDGKVYKARFVDKVASGVSVYRVITDIRKLTNVYGGKTIYFRENGFIGSREYIPGFWPGTPAIDNVYEKHHDNYRGYYTVTPPSTFIEAKIVHRAYVRSLLIRWYPTGMVVTFGLYTIYPTNYYIITTTLGVGCTSSQGSEPRTPAGCWYNDDFYHNPTLGNLLFTSVHDGITLTGTGWEPKIHVKDITGIIPSSSFTFTGRYSQAGQSLPEVPVKVSEPYPSGTGAEGIVMNSFTSNIGQFDSNSIPFAFLTNNGSLTVLDQFTTSIPVPQGLAMGKLQIVDVDIDSDNNDSINPPNRSDTEDDIEETQPGKFVTVNFNDDNGNTIPDYSDELVSGEGNVVPLVVEVRPQLDWTKVKLIFSYSGEPTLPSFIPQDMDNDFKDYTNAKKGIIRIWDISSPNETRTTDKYIQPGREYSAIELDFNGEKTFYIEGINPENNTKIEVTLIYGGQTCKDSVIVTVVEPNLGVNNSNDPNDPDLNLRPGVPDVNFVIDGDDNHDEMVEDQKDGFNFWWSRDFGGSISLSGIVDVAPLLIDVPTSLWAAGFKFYLKVSNGLLYLYPGVSPSANRRGYLQNVNTANVQIMQDGIPLTPIFIQRIMLQNAGKNDFVFKGIGDGKSSVIISLLIEEPTTSNRVVADSVKITFRDIQDHWLFVSARGTPNVPFTYPTEDNRTVDMQRYPDPITIGGKKDFAKKKHLIMVHGYNVTEEQAKDGYNELYKRLYWLGFRGNFIGLTWDSNEGFPSVVLFDTQVQNAFQTSPAFQWFLKNRVLATWSISPSDVDIMVHSLGNLVVFDALRLHRRIGTGELARNIISFESATWPEAYQAEEKIVYERLPNSDTITYPMDQLKRYSWAFWFRQKGCEAKEAIKGKIYHSYLPDDPALAAMRFNDYKERGTSLEHIGEHERQKEWHYWRNRLIQGNNYRAPEGVNNFYNIIPTLMLSVNRHVPYGLADLNLPVGTRENPIPDTINYLASDGGWMPPQPPGNIFDIDAHSRYLAERFPQIYKWYRIFLAGQGDKNLGEPELVPAIPIGEE